MMKAIDFDRECGGNGGIGYRRWDLYEQFYFDHGSFTVFESGAVAYRRGQPDPSERVTHEKFGVTVYSTAESLPRITTLEGEEIPKSWLAHKGIQYFLHDHKHNKIVGLHNMTDDRKMNIPTNLRHRARVFWPTSDALPIGANMHVFRPAQLTDVEWDYVAQIKRLAKALCALEGYNSNNTDAVWTPKRLRECMAAYPDPAQALPTLDHNIARAMAFAGNSWLDRDRHEIKFLQEAR